MAPGRDSWGHAGHLGYWGLQKKDKEILPSSWEDQTFSTKAFLSVVLGIHWIQGLTHTRQALYQWAISTAHLLFFKLPIFTGESRILGSVSSIKKQGQFPFCRTPAPKIHLGLPDGYLQPSQPEILPAFQWGISRLLRESRWWRWRWRWLEAGVRAWYTAVCRKLPHYWLSELFAGREGRWQPKQWECSSGQGKIKEFRGTEINTFFDKCSRCI